MLKKSFIVSLCFIFFFVHVFIPDASARERRGGGDNDALQVSAIVLGVVAIGCLVTYILSRNRTSVAEARINTETEMQEDFNKGFKLSRINKIDSTVEQEYSESNSTNIIASLSLEF